MRLPLERWGRGPRPALFLHGFTGSRGAFGHLEALLGDALTATCVDLPGHGEAPPPDSFSQTVEQLIELLEGPTVVVGYSQGARLALALAVRAPALVDRLVLESGTPGLHRRADRVARRRSDEALARLVTDLGVERFIDLWEQNPLFAGLRGLPDALRLSLRARRVSQRPEGLAAALRVLGQGAQPDLWPALISLRRPTLIVTGALDRKLTRIARRMVTDLPLAWHVTIDGAGHAPHLERPEAYAAEIRQFLAPSWDAEPEVLAP
jgi:2-succinyl-6-hydroxy-2,4-cyclohexadiene-1-carboxylate synthase